MSTSLFLAVAHRAYDTAFITIGATPAHVLTPPASKRVSAIANLAVHILHARWTSTEGHELFVSIPRLLDRWPRLCTLVLSSTHTASFVALVGITHLSVPHLVFELDSAGLTEEARHASVADIVVPAGPRTLELVVRSDSSIARGFRKLVHGQADHRLALDTRGWLAFLPESLSSLMVRIRYLDSPGIIDQRVYVIELTRTARAVFEELTGTLSRPELVEIFGWDAYKWGNTFRGLFPGWARKPVELDEAEAAAEEGAWTMVSMWVDRAHTAYSKTEFVAAKAHEGW